ncbi:hypothetical protein [Paenibacillus mesotrionivorans]|uniref:Uncharacterized protein n=1 Tax=Paenibacillus mesotrionivorans TaxID=3160968 RepID=A0ACC7P3M0_9BACL
MKKAISKSTSSFIIFLVTILIISLSIPAWLNHKQSTATVTSSIETQEEEFLDNRKQMEEEFKQELLEADVSQPILEKDWALELTNEQPVEIPKLPAISTVEAKGNENDSISLMKSKTQEKRNKRIFKEDQFNYHQKDVEELMLKGISLEDIYMSDQIGNDWMVEPRKLLERKENGKPSWEAIEKEVEEHVDRELSDLTQKLNKKVDQISQEVPNKAERLEILKQLKQNGKLSLDQAIHSFKTNKHEELIQLKEAAERGQMHE